MELRALIESLKAVLDLPGRRQKTEYTCGPAALASVLAGIGIKATEQELAKEMGTSPKEGSPPQAIVKVAKAHGVHAELRVGLSMKALEALVKSGRPVIVAIQAWSKKPKDYSTAWNDGHYVVVVGMDDKKVMVRDPSSTPHGSMSREDFQERWHDQDGDNVYVQGAVLFDAKAGKRTPPDSAPQVK
jgi:predicted double-glycine peptidase